MLLSHLVWFQGALLTAIVSSRSYNQPMSLHVFPFLERDSWLERPFQCTCQETLNFTATRGQSSFLKYEERVKQSQAIVSPSVSHCKAHQSMVSNSIPVTVWCDSETLSAMLAGLSLSLSEFDFLLGCKGLQDLEIIDQSADPSIQC